MLSHVELHVSDLERSAQFWDWLLRLPLQSAGIVPDLTLELGAPLRDAALDRMTDIRRRY